MRWKRIANARAMQGSTFTWLSRWILGFSRVCSVLGRCAERARDFIAVEVGQADVDQGELGREGAGQLKAARQDSAAGKPGSAAARFPWRACAQEPWARAVSE